MVYKKDYKKDYKKEMEDITDRLETGIKELFESEKYKNYLQTMAKFHNYSVNNTVLIHMQMPHSQRVASYKAWKEKFNRQVKKGEKAIRIFAPIQVKSNINIEADKIDPVTKRPVVDENGEIVTEIKNVKELRFKLVPVFDISQTEGEPLPTIAENLIGNVENYETFIDALKSVSPFPITFEKLPESTDGLCIFGNENRIEIREGMSEIQTVSAVIHEIAHSILHKKEDVKLEKPDNKSLKTEEVEAESVSYVVCQHFGIETSANSFGYITSWSSGKELKELKDSLETIRNTSANIINNVEEYLAEIQKNRENQKKFENETEITLNSLSEPISLEEPQNNLIMPDKDITIEERNKFGYDYESMLPLTQKRALELFDSDNAVYTLFSDNTESMVFERDEILNAKDVIFGIEKEDWEMSEEYKQLKVQLENETPSENKDKYLIYQLKDGGELHSYRFVSFEELKKNDLKIDVNNYEFVYSGDLKENDTLDTIYNEFNTTHPDNFRGHSLSVSDVVVIEKDNEISSYYVDRIGFKELPVFLGNETFPSKKEIEIDSACISNYKGMTAFVGSDDYVYLGKSENYHYGEICYYDNSDKSMMFMSDNKEIYYFLYNDSWNISQQEMLDSGYYKKEVYEEFDRLQKTVLKDLPYKDGFDGIKFDGEPFVPPDKLIIREETKIADKSEEVSETVSIQNNNDLIGKTVIINDRQFLIDDISEISGRVSMIDLTFQQRAGFPITREESIDYVRKFLKQEKEKSISEKNNSETLDKSVNADKKFCNENKKPKRNSILETIKENKKEMSKNFKENKEIKKQDRRIL